MKRIHILGIAASALGAVVAGVPLSPARAAGQISQTRELSGFDKIRLTGVFETQITAGARQTRVVVTGSPDVVARVTTEVRNGTLIVGMRSGTSNETGLRLTIALPALRALDSAGVGNTAITGLTGSAVALTASGAGSIVASGRAGSESISLSGAGKIDATGVDAKDVTVNSSGVGSVKVRASGTLSMNVSGVGEIRYTGQPTHVESHVSGVGSIGRL
jgi:hypothetical protein